jgi:hypothetical protein
MWGWAIELVPNKLMKLERQYERDIRDIITNLCLSEYIAEFRSFGICSNFYSTNPFGQISYSLVSLICGKWVLVISPNIPKVHPSLRLNTCWQIQQKANYWGKSKKTEKNKEHHFHESTWKLNTPWRLKTRRDLKKFEENVRDIGAIELVPG